MKTTKDIIANAAAFVPGAKLSIKGYTNSGGETRDFPELQVLASDGYYALQKLDLDILREFKVTEAIEGASVEDLQTALRNLVEAREKARDNTAAFAQYEKIPGEALSSLSTLAKSPESVYLLRLENKGELADSKPAKGAIPRAKQILTKHLSLPSRRYIHTLKFTDGKFVEIKAL